jgi:hypothetical protein
VVAAVTRAAFCHTHVNTRPALLFSFQLSFTLDFSHSPSNTLFDPDPRRSNRGLSPRQLGANLPPANAPAHYINSPPRLSTSSSPRHNPQQHSTQLASAHSKHLLRPALAHSKQNSTLPQTCSTSRRCSPLPPSHAPSSLPSALTVSTTQLPYCSVTQANSSQPRVLLQSL